MTYAHSCSQLLPTCSIHHSSSTARCWRLGFKVPGSIVEKSELKTLLAEAEREAAERKGPLGMAKCSAKRDLKACGRNIANRETEEI